MKKHAIIPIFVPHIGCSESCVFCDQKQITARSKAPSPEEVRNTIETWLETLSGLEKEIAFYGGSFTAIPMSMQEGYLSIAKEYLDRGLVSGLHLSTRPDAINTEILEMLSSYGVRTIELGVQSFDDRVLSLSKRGHDAETVRRACELINNFGGFDLGIQLMVGLPGDSMEACIYSAKEAVKLKPALARIYPTLVLEGTELMEMYRSGAYLPLSREEAIARSKEIYEILNKAGIYIMRIGLKSTDVINSENLGEINSGAYHPAFRQLVEGEIAKDKILDLLSSELDLESANRITLNCSPGWISNAVGHNGVNKEYFMEKYPSITITFSEDKKLSPGEFSISNNIE